ncbi:MAG: hypothetical protein JNM66_01300 [Bryobacterales bacterium]|nr:hypothetical protein [Bryobacterales bacterium]
MQDLQYAVPSLAEAKNALANLATEEALGYLESAVQSLRALSVSLQGGDRMEPAAQRSLERRLLRFRAELRDAGALAESGLAYCQDWAQQLEPPAVYGASGVSAATAVSRPELSVEG